MTEAALHDQAGHAEPSHTSLYFKIFWTLFGFTLAEYFYAMFAGRLLGIPMLIVGLLAMALYKATLVALFFMHLKFEGKWVLAMLVPTAFLVVVFFIGLTPDVIFHDSGEELDSSVDDLPVAAAPLTPGALASSAPAPTAIR